MASLCFTSSSVGPPRPGLNPAAAGSPASPRSSSTSAGFCAQQNRSAAPWGLETRRASRDAEAFRAGGRRMPLSYRHVAFSLALVCVGVLMPRHAEAIVRGHPAGAIAHHVVLLKSPSLLCSATVVGRQEVLTAAHCVESIRALYVIAGGQRIAVTDSSSYGGPVRLTLARPLPSPCRPIEIGGGASGPGTIAGYGVAYESPRAPSAGLREARVVAQDGYGPLVGPERKGGVSASACMGDSGGPAAVFDGNRYVLIGIIDRASYPSSWRACGFYTHVVPVGGSFAAMPVAPRAAPAE